ncbi:MAG: hypothetical protein ACRDVM_05345, partial [Acidimicrobiia bacterium]
VTIRSTNETEFARAIGDTELTVVSQAVADCEDIPFAGGYALFAGAESCGPDELSFNTATAAVNGGVHSNGDYNRSGGSYAISGEETYRGDVTPPTYSGGEKLLGAALDYPVDYDIADYRPGGAKSSDPNYHSTTEEIDNQWLVDNAFGTGNPGAVTITQPGIYYTSADISLQNATAGPGVTVTLVAEGQIHLIGGGTLRAYDDLLLMFSNRPGSPACNSIAIRWSTNSSVWTGVIFAPNGVCRQDNATGSSVNGSVICYRIDLNGSTFNITWQDDPSAEPEYRVELLK